jgi:GNAT superfamily N-acetyltransferase
MKALLRIAIRQADILRCRAIIAAVYSGEYGVVFSSEHFDLDAKIEPWPHRYVMVEIDGELVATSGLYLRDTYVERYGEVSEAEFAAVLAAAGATEYEVTARREITKFVVAPLWRGRGMTRVLARAAFSRDFLQLDATEPHMLVMCARHTIWENVFHGNGIQTRILKPFPFYKVHDKYRSPEDPMDSRLILPDRDIPPHVYGTSLPCQLDVEAAENLS